MAIGKYQVLKALGKIGYLLIKCNKIESIYNVSESVFLAGYVAL